MMERAALMTFLLAASAGLVPAPAAAHSTNALLANRWHPQTEFARTTANGEFVLIVSPNLVDHASASAAALAESGRYCHSIGKTAPAGFTRVRRYSNYVLDGWEFAGACK